MKSTPEQLHIGDLTMEVEWQGGKPMLRHPFGSTPIECADRREVTKIATALAHAYECGRDNIRFSIRAILNIEDAA
jgi:hypothetical protein